MSRNLELIKNIMHCCIKKVMCLMTVLFVLPCTVHAAERLPILQALTRVAGERTLIKEDDLNEIRAKSIVPVTHSKTDSIICMTTHWLGGFASEVTCRGLLAYVIVGNEDFGPDPNYPFVEFRDNNSHENLLVTEKKSGKVVCVKDNVVVAEQPSNRHSWCFYTKVDGNILKGKIHPMIYVHPMAWIDPFLVGGGVLVQFGKQ